MLLRCDKTRERATFDAWLVRDSAKFVSDLVVIRSQIHVPKKIWSKHIYALLFLISFRSPKITKLKRIVDISSWERFSLVKSKYYLKTSGINNMFNLWQKENITIEMVNNTEVPFWITISWALCNSRKSYETIPGNVGTLEQRILKWDS